MYELTAEDTPAKPKNGAYGGQVDMVALCMGGVGGRGEEQLRVSITSTVQVFLERKHSW